MTILMKSILTCLLACLFPLDPLTAQEPPAEGQRPPRGRLAHLVATGIPEGLENPVKVLSGTEVVEVTLSKRNTTEPVKIPADGVIRIVREAGAPAASGKPSYLTLARATVPESAANALVILIPVAKKAGSDQVFRSEIHDLAGFNGGDFLYLNLTNLNIKVEMGKDTLPLKPGETRIYDSPSLAQPVNMPTRYSFMHPVQKKWRMLSASTIVLQSTRREICIFSWDPKLERVDYHGLTFPVTP